MAHTITITLPEPVYERFQVTAEVLSLPVETVVTESLELVLPAFESDMPRDVQADLARLTCLSDLELWKIAHQQMAHDKQGRFETLAEWQKQRTLSPGEQHDLNQLLCEAQHLMLTKAEAYRLLAQRGHTVFSPGEQE